jgi:membrane protease YdiL (CAAX protease family)
METDKNPIWRRLPVILRAVLSGSALALAGTIPWALLAGANQKVGSNVPWAAGVMSLYLWLFWQWAQGTAWPRSTAQARRMNLRARPLSSAVWGSALLAGGLGIACLVLFLRMVNRLVRLPVQHAGDLSHIPMVTLVISLLMASVVAGVVEEASFRGYMQGPIERKHGPALAILVTGIVFGLAHFTHPEVTLILMPYYLAVAAVYGALAYLTNSILPSMVLHTGGNALGYVDLLARGRSEWQASSVPAPLIWETGVDRQFAIACVVLLMVAAVAVWAYRTLAIVARAHIGPDSRAGEA